ncbi:MAG: hypothetical protein HY774_21520 [Acidobacteria bacterium]|nr:hypothetical protein [Acidobacteriota bacterium]
MQNLKLIQRPSGRETGLDGELVVALKAAQPPATLRRPPGGIYQAQSLFLQRVISMSNRK